jgi:hypothetical protein
MKFLCLLPLLVISLFHKQICSTSNITLPTSSPTVGLTLPPTTGPTNSPSPSPTPTPSIGPSAVPTTSPTSVPTTEPISLPTTEPTELSVVSIPLISPNETEYVHCDFLTVYYCLLMK